MNSDMNRQFDFSIERIDKNGLHNNVLSYKEMWKIALSSPSFEDIHREQQSLPDHVFYLTSHNSILHVFCLCSSSKACPNSVFSLHKAQKRRGRDRASFKSIEYFPQQEEKEL